MRNICTLAAAAMLVAACAAQAIDSPAPPPQLASASTGQTTAFDPCNLKARLHSQPTEVLVLGSMHLSGTPEGFDAADYFAGRALRSAAMAEAEPNLTPPQAEAKVRSMLRDWPESPAAAERCRLASLFLASGDPHSALVQWWRLKAEERVSGDGISAETH